ncbi:MAG: DUF885 domain-containing protein [Gemmatimonadetes bacterium]|nr:DUF885 domain-containing protein [Gemmatimonadota bacterium]
MRAVALMIGVLAWPAGRIAGAQGTPATFAMAVDQWLDAFARRHPSIAAGNGIHAYDDRMEDFSAGAMAREVTALKRERKLIAAFPANALTPDERVDQRILVGIIDGWLLDVETIASWKKNPMVYGDALFAGVHNLMTMESAPLEVRARTLIAKLRGLDALLAALKANVSHPPKLYAERGQRMFTGAREAIGSDVALAFAKLPASKLRDSLAMATAAAAATLDAFLQWYQASLLPTADGSFAIGQRNLEARYRAEELIDLPAPTLLAIGLRELKKAQAQFTEAAARIDPKRPAIDVWHDIEKDHPPQGGVVAAAKAAVDQLTAFVIAKGLAEIPTAERPIVAAAPPFDLGLASSHASPPLEKTPVTSYYYVTDARADWPRDRQDAWLRKFNRSTLTIISAHEVMPGHWLHAMHMRETPGKVRRIWIGLNPFPQPSSGQDGWAHYAEQLVVDQGLGDNDPRLKLGQLSEALTRICRLISSAKLHLGQFTVDQAAAFFEKEAHLPAPAARNEAERGTYDPTNGGYFLGKMAALKLRADVQAREGASFDLKRFHERVMHNGIAPWWAHRQLLLPGDNRPVIE